MPYPELCARLFSAAINTSSRCLFENDRHAKISSNVRKHPKQTSLSSRQQFLTQGLATCCGDGFARICTEAVGLDIKQLADL